jgi:hypothetical protein
LARKLSRHVSSVISFQKNATIQTAILCEICHVLKHYFFNDIAAQLPIEFTSEALANTHLEERNAALDDELKTVKAERDILLKAKGK